RHQICLVLAYQRDAAGTADADAPAEEPATAEVTDWTPGALDDDALAAVLGRRAGQTDVALGSPVVNRATTDLEGVVGLLLNTVAVRVSLSGRPTFRELLRRARETVVDARAHDAIPFDAIVEALRPDRDLTRHPVFDVLINVDNTSPRRLELPDVTVEAVEIPDAEAKYPITLYAREADDAIELRWVFRAARFDVASIRELSDQFLAFVGEVVRGPDVAVGRVCLRTAAAAASLPDPTAPLVAAPTEPLPAGLVDVMRARGARTAIEHEDARITYAELAERVNALALELNAKGVRRGDVVTIAGERTPGVVVAMCATLAAGAVLMTADPELPVARRQAMIEAAGARHVVAVGGAASDIEHLFATRTAVDAATGAVAAPSARAPGALPTVAAEDPAYVFFTSGSTGQPKGILGVHRGLAHFVRWQIEEFGLRAEDRFAQTTALSFDVVLRDVLTPLVAGAVLCIPARSARLDPARLMEWLASARVTVVHTVPTLAAAWLRAQRAAVPSLRLAFFAGEPLTDAIVTRFCEAFPACSLVNLYGPTETTLAKCFHRVTSVRPGVQPVGRAMPGAQAIVVNDDGTLAGVAEPGEVWIRTPYRSLGYLDASNGADRFVPNPFRSEPGDVVYRTGDRGLYAADGALELCGRLDDQVKIRGVRVELAEVTAALARCSGIGACAVVAREGPDGAPALVAYVVSGSADAVDASALRRELARVLPTAAVPAAFVTLPDLPRLANGKVDRRALPAPTWSTSTARVEPRDEVERLVCRICEDVLGRPVSIDANFFDAGGHSLHAAQVVARVQEALHVELPLRAVFEAATL
ncbi:MAG TPA: amino acid adenylation domain-containing protein, partial [Minicystis sp.]|nr:amino acid adenylation domain-containing protein [Minicystis sp.]